MLNDHRDEVKLMSVWLTQFEKRKRQWSGCLVYRHNAALIETLTLLEGDETKPALDQLILQATKRYKDDRATTVVEVKNSYILKRYNARNTQHLFSRALRQTRARRCWQRSYDFAKAGINVAAPAFMYEQRFGPIRLDAYFANEKLAGQELLSLLPTMSAEQKGRVAQQMQSVFEKMRAAKLTHGDMKASNILWVNGELYFIDLDAARKHLTLLTWNHSHKKDRKRFMKNWRNQPELLALFKQL